jgi:hypothetical protein
MTSMPAARMGLAEHRARLSPSPATLRTALIGAAILCAALGYALTLGAAAEQAARTAGPELTRLLRMMAVLKCLLGAGALFLVSLRFRFPIARPLAAAYIAAGAVMAAGPGVIWNMAHIWLGTALLHGGLAALFCLGWADGGTRWRRLPARR